MTQPKFAPILPNDEVRDLYRLAAPAAWVADRPADFRADPGAAHKAGRGSAGPDQGYAMLLLERYADRIEVSEGEHLDDVMRGIAVVAMKRAALFGRAPVSADLEVGLGLFGYLAGASAEQVEARRALFGGVSHDYAKERALVDVIPEATLRMTLAAIADQLAGAPAAFAELSGVAG
ncbi:MAG: hypothetical protein ACLPQS_09820 [Acidimicrobiales bacterium]